MTISSNSRRVGPETSKTYQEKINNGFWQKYITGPNVLEIGFDGGVGAETIFPYVIGIDKDYPDYDGLHLPFEDESQDAVYASHVYEHINDWKTALQEWYRVLRVGGHMIIAVPHVWLYEKKPDLPSRYNTDHKRFYAPYNLLEEVWQALPHLGYRIRHFCDNDKDWEDGWIEKVVEDPYANVEVAGNSVGYHHEDGRRARVVSVGEMHPSKGCYEIELVLEKTEIPVWTQYAFKTRKILGRG